MFVRSITQSLHSSMLVKSFLESKTYFIRNFATDAKHFNIVFFGSDNVSLPILEGLYNDSKKTDGVVNSLEVVCNSMEKAKHKGRKPKKPVKESTLLPVEDFCLTNNINYHPLPALNSLKEWTIPQSLQEGTFNMLVCASFGYFIPSSILNLFKYGGINVHPSLLPKYRGPSPIISTLLNGDKCTGVSIITLDPKKIDTGGVLYQKQMNISDTIKCPELTEKLATLGSECSLYTLYNYDKLLNEIEPQDPLLESSYTHKITSEMANISFEDTNINIYNKFRAISHIYPLKCQHIHTLPSVKLDEKNTITNTIILRDLFIPPTNSLSFLSSNNTTTLDSLPIGSIKYVKRTKNMYVKCGQNTWLGIKALQIMPKSITIPSHVFINQFKENNLFKKLE